MKNKNLKQIAAAVIFSSSLLLAAQSTESAQAREERLAQTEKRIDYIDSQRSFSLTGRGFLYMDNSVLTGAGVLTNIAQKKHDNSLAVDLALEKSIFPFITAHGALRFKSDFSGFYVQGETFEVRDVWIESYAFDFLTLRAGNFAQKLTPLTMQFSASPLGYKADLFNLIEEKFQYDAHQSSDAWYQQGFLAKGDFTVDKVPFLNTLGFNGSVTPYGTLDFKKFISAAGLKAGMSNTWNMAYHLVRYDDRSSKYSGSTAANFTQDLSVHSGSGEFDFGRLFSKANKSHSNLGLGASLGAEFAASIYRGDTNGERKGSSLSANAAFKIFGNIVTGKFLKTGEEFYSPLAQTPSHLEYLGGPSPAFIDQTNMNAHFSERQYTTDISFRHIWNLPTALSMPMGAATPNRLGFSLGYKFETLKFFNAEAEFGSYAEDKPIAGNNRKFLTLDAGAELKLKALHKRLPVIAFGTSYEKETRNDPLTTYNEKMINFTLSSSLKWEFASKVSLTAAWQMFSQDGFRHVEYQSALKPYYQLDTYYVDHQKASSNNIKQNLVMAGISYAISKNASINLFYKLAADSSVLHGYTRHAVNVYSSLLF